MCCVTAAYVESAATDKGTLMKGVSPPERSWKAARACEHAMGAAFRHDWNVQARAGTPIDAYTASGTVFSSAIPAWNDAEESVPSGWCAVPWTSVP